MTVYNVSGLVRVSAHVETEAEALAALRTMVSRVEMDVVDENAYYMGLPAAPGWIASGMIAALFEASSEQEAIGRMMVFVLDRAGILPTGMVAFESEEIPEELMEWVR